MDEEEGRAVFSLVGDPSRHANPMGSECEVTDEGGALVCKLSSTCMVLRGDSAKGR